MNNLEKLTEATILSLQNKLIENEDEWKYDDNETPFENLWSAVCNNIQWYVKNYFNKHLGEPNQRYDRFGYKNSLIMGALRNNNYDMVNLLKSFGETILVDELDEYKSLMAKKTYEDDITKSAKEN